MKKFILIVVVIIISAIAGLGISMAKAATTPATQDDPANTAVLNLDYGPVVIRLRPDLAPKHVARIKELMHEGFYNGLIFHRVIDGFMAQTGDPTGTGMGGSGKKLPAEFTSTPFKRGTVGMARSSDPNSADSQFFIMFDSGSFLNGKYTVVGEVVRGMEFVDQSHKGEPPVQPDRIVTMKLENDTQVPPSPAIPGEKKVN